MLAKRIIPCLDVKDGRTVKGIKFKNLIDAGDPVALGALYSAAGADELVFLDITASHENRNTAAELAKEVAKELNIPFTIGGGIKDVYSAGAILHNGADKISVNSAAVRDPDLIDGLAHAFGSQAVVVAIDAEKQLEGWRVYVSGGRTPTDKYLIEWAQEVESRGAGEILFTSMNHDGMKNGFALEALQSVCTAVSIPVIASGGAGTKAHFTDVFQQTWCTGALAASIFHYKEIEISDLKNYLISQGINMRI
jgi:cyclase